MDRHSECQAYVHAAGIRLHRAVDEVADAGEGQDVGKLRLDFGPLQTEYGAVEKYILTTGEFRIEPRAKLEQRRHAATHVHVAARGSQCPADDLQQRRFARTVAAHDADGFAAFDVEVHIPQGFELAIPAPIASGAQHLEKAVMWLVVDRGNSCAARVPRSTAQRTSANPLWVAMNQACPSQATSPPTSVANASPIQFGAMPASATTRA